MRLGVNAPILTVTLLIAATALGANNKQNRKKSRAEASHPAIVVAVVNLKVDSDKDNVKSKVAELTDKLRTTVEEAAKSYEVISARQMRVIAKRHRKAINNCYDDCDVEFGKLAGASFVIGGHLEPSTSGIIGTLEIRNTQNRSVVATKKVSGANYFELESVMLAAVKRFVRPLNHVAFQATDDEIVRDSAVKEETSAEEDVTGLGTTSDAVTTSNDSGGEDSDYIAKQEEEEEDKGNPALAARWEAAKEEPPFMKERDLGFEKDDDPSIFGVGINVGYSFNIARARHLRNLYTPIFHIGVQAQARIHHLFEIAIVADIDYLTGGVHTDNRFGVAEMNMGTDDEPDLIGVERYNEYNHGNYLTVGLRPTARLIVPTKFLEFFVGVGLGANYVKTSGYWYTHATATQIYPQDLGVPPQAVEEDVAYNFTHSSIGFYAVFEGAVIVRAFSDRIGVGALFQLKMPAMWASGARSSVSVDQDAYVSEAFGKVSSFLVPTPNDAKNSPIGHVDSLNLMTLGLIADWRF